MDHQPSTIKHQQDHFCSSSFNAPAQDLRSLNMPNNLYSNLCNRCLVGCSFLHQIVPQSTIETYLTRCCSTHLGMPGEGESVCWDTIDYERIPVHNKSAKVLKEFPKGSQNVFWPTTHSATIYFTANGWDCRLDPTNITVSHSPTPSPLFPCRFQLGSTLASPQVYGGWLGPYSVYGWLITLTTKKQLVGLING